MNIVVVRYSDDAVVPLGCEENLVSDRSAQRADPPPAQIWKRTKLPGIGRPYAQDLPKLVIRKSDRVGRAAGGRIFNPAESDVRIAARNGLIDRGERNLDEPRLPSEAPGEELGDIHIESDDPRWVGRV